MGEPKKKTREESRNYMRDWRAANPDRAKHYGRKAHLKSAYEMSEEEYDRLEQEQKSLCAICHQAQSDGHRLCIDHDHETGKIRGLLCHSCNKALGFFKDSVLFLEAAIRYLNSERHTMPTSVEPKREATPDKSNPRRWNDSQKPTPTPPPPKRPHRIENSNKNKA
jgi:hypothetical protein